MTTPFIAIENAVVAIAEGNGKASEFANDVLRADGKTIFNQIITVYKDTRLEQNRLKKLDELDNGSRLDEMAYRAGFVFTFLQRLSNRATFAALRAYDAQAEQDKLEALDEIPWGTDNVADSNAELGYEACSTREIREEHEFNFRQLLKLQGHLAACNRNMDIDPLYMLENTEAVQVGDSDQLAWVQTHSAMTWDEAYATRADLREIWSKRDEDQLNKLDDIDFMDDDFVAARAA